MVPQGDNPDSGDLRVANLVQSQVMALDIKYIKDAMSALESAVKGGFIGVHSRQDTTNGRISKAENQIELLKAKTVTLDVLRNVLWSAVTGLMGLVGYLLAHWKP